MTVTREGIIDGILALLYLAAAKGLDAPVMAFEAAGSYAAGTEPECGRCVTCGAECRTGGEGSVVCPNSCGELTDERKHQLRDIANAEYASGSDDDIEVDDEPKFSVGDGGVWVSAWVWVAAEETCSNAS